MHKNEILIFLRPVIAEYVALMSAINSKMPPAYSAPVHVSDPEATGFVDLTRPEFGDAVAVAAGEILAFWARGTTPQVVA